MPKVVHWNPRANLGNGRVLARIHIGPRVNNFGDLLGPRIVERVRERLSLGRDRSPARRLLTVGSILHLAREHDIVWGSGINGKMQREHYPRLDVRAVRGPLTAERLRRAQIESPDVYGDPALLIPYLWSDQELDVERGSSGTVLVPNLHDRSRFPNNAIDPRQGIASCVREIASANLVISSSLHGIVVAEAFGVPAVLVKSPTEPMFKFEDYYLGTGRSLPSPVGTWREGLDATPAPPITRWNPDSLLDAFPTELWEPRNQARGLR